MKNSGWKYYVKSYGETAEDAAEITIRNWDRIHDAEGAAQYAAENDWDNGGCDAGIGKGPVITVISPDGDESDFNTETEASVEFIAWPHNGG